MMTASEIDCLLIKQQAYVRTIQRAAIAATALEFMHKRLPPKPEASEDRWSAEVAMLVMCTQDEAERSAGIYIDEAIREMAPEILAHAKMIAERHIVAASPERQEA